MLMPPPWLWPAMLLLLVCAAMAAEVTAVVMGPMSMPVWWS
jgi:hypothetical protein